VSEAVVPGIRGRGKSGGERKQELLCDIRRRREISNGSSVDPADRAEGVQNLAAVRYRMSRKPGRESVTRNSAQPQTRKRKDQS